MLLANTGFEESAPPGAALLHTWVRSFPSRRLRAVQKPRLSATAFADPQLELWERSDEQWRTGLERPVRPRRVQGVATIGTPSNAPANASAAEPGTQQRCATARGCRTSSNAPV